MTLTTSIQTPSRLSRRRGQGGLLVRVDPADADAWIDDEGVTPMVMRGREMRGWLRVISGLDGDGLERWVSRGVAYARSLPPKSM